MDQIPVLIICYNNHLYVDNMVKQLVKFGNNLHINIVDQNSNHPDTIEYLNTCGCKIIHRLHNSGPWIDRDHNTDLYDMLPNKFIVTDPDLELNPNLPSNFIDILAELSEKYYCNKIGFALDISDFDQMYQTVYNKNKNIHEWESQFWARKLESKEYELYHGFIDTTFHLYNKKYKKRSIRIAGNFIAKHLPWYCQNKLLNVYENYQMNINTTCISSISKIILNYIKTKYLVIHKQSIPILIENNQSDPNLRFWKNRYSDWEPDTFKIMDQFLNKNKIFIDLGGWIGTTCIYASHKSKHVYVVEVDSEALKYLNQNCTNNCTNCTIIDKAIYNINDTKINFGPNLLLDNSKLNDSCSQIHISQNNNVKSQLVSTINLEHLIQDYQIDPTSISLIKVDVEGSEEFILEDLYKLHKTYKIPIYVSFHQKWWNNPDLHRFTFLSNQQINLITRKPFSTMLMY